MIKSHEFETYKRKKNLSYSKVFTIVFLLIIGIFTYYIFGDPNLTGNVISNSNERNIQINGKLELPETSLMINGQIEKIELIANPSKLKSETNNFDFSKKKKISIIIENYVGELEFDSDNILNLNGRTNKLFLDGTPITSEGLNKIQIENAEYDFIKINNFELNSLQYKTSGELKINNKIKIELNQDKIQIKRFKGNAEIRNNQIILNGNSSLTKNPSIIRNKIIQK